MVQRRRNGPSRSKQKLNNLQILLITISLALMGCDVCHAFLVQSPIPQPKRQNQQYLAKPSRWKLQSKRTPKEDKTPSLEQKDNPINNNSWFGRIPAMMASTCAAVCLLFAASNAAFAGDVPEYLSISERDIQIQANKKLVDYAVGTVNTQFYDSSGGARFNPSDFYRQWRDLQSKLEVASGADTSSNAKAKPKTLSPLEDLGLDTRDGTVQTLKYLVSTLKDPYSKYMTREELEYELKGSHDGFLGTGAYIEVPKTTEGQSANLASSFSNSQSSSSTSYSSSSLPTTPKAEQKSNFQANIRRERLSRKSSSQKSNFQANIRRERLSRKSSSQKQTLLSTTKVANLPVVTAVAPNSPAERAGLVVGDKIVGVGQKDNFLGYGKDEIRKCLGQKWGYSDPNNTKLVSKQLPTDSTSFSRYFGVADLTIAKPVYSYSMEESTGVARADNPSSMLQKDVSNELLMDESSTRNREIVLGYRSTKVKLPTIATDPSPKALASSTSSSRSPNLRGDAVVQYELLSSSSAGLGSSLLSGSSNILNEYALGESEAGSLADSDTDKKVGYIRLTRFSKSSTEGYLNAVKTLEEEGAQSYVIDLRNNYGGVIQEAMLTASTLLGDQHAILCYLLNARGGFTPVDVESYVVDPRYPGYLLSKQDKTSVLEQTIKENPKMFQTVSEGEPIGRRSTSIRDDLVKGMSSSTSNNKRLIANWDPPSSYASIHEQVAKRGIHRITYASLEESSDANSAYGTVLGGKLSNLVAAGKKDSNSALLYRQRMQQQKLLQKDIVLLINEGTASSAEFFVAALQDNGRSLAVVGTKSFGKGIIQHTFPMPDGGGLKLTIGEFLRPSLKHVTNAFGVGFVDKASGEIVGGGGVNPDVYCESRQGIPGSPSSDLCVKVALDVLEEHRSLEAVDASVASTNDAVSGTNIFNARGSSR